MSKFVAKAKTLKKKMDNPWWRARKKYPTYYDTLPIDEKAILIESQHGTQMSGNVFYLMRYLTQSEKYKGYTVYLSARGSKEKDFRAMLDSYGLEKVKTVILASEEYYALIASAKYLINDNTFLPFFMKKEGQVYLNTWHGTPLKTLGRQIKSEPHAIGNTQRNFLFADYLLFPNEYTRDAIISDYMLENISRGSYVMSGYPRNERFFDKKRDEDIRRAENIEGRRVYAYMPTFRGSAAKGGTSKNTHYLNYYLYELDKRLSDDEILYVNLHPVAKNDVNFKDFTHIKKFPAEYETYDFLSACDLLITDYSSVFFDYAAGGKKVVLFTYDKEEYLCDRGMYMSIDSLPFPQVDGVDSLLSELRSEKNYDDSEFLEKFCKYEGPRASEMLMDSIILGEKCLTALPIPSNGKENVLIYGGNLAANGVTTSLLSLLNTVDRTKRNYFITFKTELVGPNRAVLNSLPDGVCYIATMDDTNLTLSEQVIRGLFKNDNIKAGLFMKSLSQRLRQGFIRCYADAKFDTVIQFNGYESEVILTFATFPGRRIIFVHSDMLSEIKTRSNHRLDVLKYAYNAYDHVAVVTDDIMATTRRIAGEGASLSVVKNTIDFEGILAKASIPLDGPDYDCCTVSFERLSEILNSDAPKFINIGRFAPEKGQDRLINAFARFREQTPDSYLIIMGGNSFKGHYEVILEQVQKMGLSDRVILIMKTPNPYRILNKCDYFVLSSFYEGFGLVLAEADILGKPVISTDITGPRLFMQQNGGKLVDNSEDGILEGMRLMADGKVKPMGVDYKKYNEEIISSFENLFS